MDRKFIVSLIISTLSGLSTLLGYLIIYIKIKNINKYISFFLTFSFSIMINISIFELIPEAFIYFSQTYNVVIAILITSLIFISVNLFINRMSRVVKEKNKESSNLYKVGILSTIVLFFHNVPEGIATFISSYNNIKLGLTLAISIIMHNIPEGMNIAIPIYYSTYNKKKTFKYVMISALAEPFGAIITYVLLYKFINNYFLNIILLVVASIMINISINEIYPESITYNNEKLNKKAFLLGMLFVIMSLIIL